MEAAIVAAGLAANAVRHARSAFTVTVAHLPDRVRIWARDQVPLNDSPPTPLPGPLT
jgi:hypothetical protein